MCTVAYNRIREQGTKIYISNSIIQNDCFVFFQTQITSFLGQNHLASSQLAASQLSSSQMMASQLLSSQIPTSLTSPLRTGSDKLPMTPLSSSQSVELGNVYGNVTKQDSGVSGVGATNAPASPVKAVIETVATVLPKCLSKAMRPPVTIRSFFKSSTKVQKPEVDIKKPSLFPSKLPVETNCSGESETPEKKVAEMSYADFLNHQTGAESEIKELEAKNEKGKINPHIKTESDEKIESNLGNDKGIEMNRTESLPSRSRKRTNESDLSAQPIKRSKQVTLFSTFQKMSTKKVVEEKKAVSCPICGKEFEKGISNADLNAHIDNCIIE